MFSVGSNEASGAFFTTRERESRCETYYLQEVCQAQSETRGTQILSTRPLARHANRQSHGARLASAPRPSVEKRPHTLASCEGRSSSRGRERLLNYSHLHPQLV
eukprot:00868_5